MEEKKVEEKVTTADSIVAVIRLIGGIIGAIAVISGLIGLASM